MDYKPIIYTINKIPTVTMVLIADRVLSKQIYTDTNNLRFVPENPRRNLTKKVHFTVNTGQSE